MPAKLAYVIWTGDEEVGGGPVLPPPEVWPQPPGAGKPPVAVAPPIYLPIEPSHPIVLPPGDTAPPEIWPKPPGGQPPTMWPILPSHPIVLPEPPPVDPPHIDHELPGAAPPIAVHPIYPPPGFALIYIPGFGFAATPIGPNRPRVRPTQQHGSVGTAGKK